MGELPRVCRDYRDEMWVCYAPKITHNFRASSAVRTLQRQDVVNEATRQPNAFKALTSGTSEAADGAIPLFPQDIEIGLLKELQFSPRVLQGCYNALALRRGIHFVATRARALKVYVSNK